MVGCSWGVINLRKDKSSANVKMRKEKGPRFEGVSLGYDVYYLRNKLL